MKLIYNISKIGLLATFAMLLLLTSCKDDLPGPLDTSSNITVLKAIKIVNAGANGDMVLEGVVDEDKKTVSFPRIEPETDFSNLKFEAELSNGAKLDKESYDIAFEEGQSSKVITVKAINEPRYREYLVTLRLKVPVFGADFEKVATFDYTSNPLGNPIYEAFSGALTRGSGFDGEHVLIVRRETATTFSPHLLSVNDLKANVIKKIPLNTTGITGGTYYINMGAQIKGHTYIVNLSSNAPTNPVKIYHWTDPSVAPEIIANINVADVAGGGARHGDNFSVSLDDQGDGYIFLGDNAGGKILRLKVANYTTVTEPSAFAVPITGGGSWTSYNRIGNSAEYIFTGHDAPVALVNEGGTLSFSMSRTAIPIRGSDARVIYFNEERYLIVTTAARTLSEPTNFIVYDITKGATVKDALTNLNQQTDIKPVFEYSLMGPVNTSPASQTGFYVKKDTEGNDESLMLYSGASDTGFVFFEFPKKVAED